MQPFIFIDWNPKTESIPAAPKLFEYIYITKWCQSYSFSFRPFLSTAYICAHTYTSETLINIHFIFVTFTSGHRNSKPKMQTTPKQ